MREREWLRAAKYLSSRALPLFPLLRTQTLPGPEAAALLEAAQGGVLTGSAAVCAGVRLDARRVFLCAGAGADALRAAHGKCRYLVEDPASLRRLDALAAPLLPPGALEPVALRIRLRGGGAFTAEALPSLARLLRRTEHLAVRGLFLPMDPREDPVRQAREAFSLVKAVRAALPCTLHSFCLEGLLAPLAKGDGSLPDTLRLLADLNDTSLYAAFFVS